MTKRPTTRRTTKPVRQNITVSDPAILPLLHEARAREEARLGIDLTVSQALRLVLSQYLTTTTTTTTTTSEPRPPSPPPAAVPLSRSSARPC
jgi:hypothetical protein